VAKYSEFKYSEEFYGDQSPAPFGAELTWVLLVNWSGTTWTNEGGKLQDVQLEAGSENYLSDSGFEPKRAARLTLTLDNIGRRYDPRNDDSDLYPNVRPGKKVELSARINATGVRHVIFTGHIQDIRPVSGESGGKVRLVCSGYDGVLEKTQTPAYVSIVNTTLSAAFNRVLDQLNYPGGRSIDVDAQPIPSFDAGGDKASSVLDRLAAAGLGTFFVSKEGVATFLNRDFTPRATHTLDQVYLAREVLPSQPWDDVYNKTVVIANRPIRQQGAVIWSLPNPVAFTSGNAFTLNILYDPATDIAIDATEANTLASGEGTDITSSLTLTSFALSYGGGTMTFTPSANGYLTKLEIRGRAFDTVQEEYTYDDSTGQADGVTLFELDSPYLQDPNYASTFAAELGAYLKDYRDTVKLMITQRPALQLPLDVMDKVELTLGDLDLSGDYYILGYSHEWGEETGQELITTVWLRDVFTSDTAITPAPVEEIPAPLGYKNPAGDPTTIEGNSGGDDSVIYIPAACSLLGTGSKVSNAASAFSTYTDTLLWSSEWSDKDGMITPTAAAVVVTEPGVYMVAINGFIQWLKTFSADEDEVGLTFGRAWTIISKNGSGVNTSANNIVQQTRFAKGGGYWTAFTPILTALMVDCNVGDALTVDLTHANVSNVGTLTLTYRVYLNIWKVRNL